MKKFSYTYTLTVNGKKTEVVIRTNNIVSYFYHKARGMANLSRGRSYYHDGSVTINEKEDRK